MVAEVVGIKVTFVNACHTYTSFGVGGELSLLW